MLFPLASCRSTISAGDLQPVHHSGLGACECGDYLGQLWRQVGVRGQREVRRSPRGVDWSHFGLNGGFVQFECADSF